jgi:acyl-homoserine-lactone acylase
VLAVAVSTIPLVASKCSFDPTASYSAEVRRTEGGIPHIRANDFASLGYGTGYAMAQDNFCLMADQFLTYSAERSRYLGPDNGNVSSDLFYQLLIDQGGTEEPVAEANSKIFRGAAAGYNRYLREVGIDGLPAECAGADWVRPVTEVDFARITRTEFLLPFFSGLLLAANPPAAPAASEGGIVIDPTSPVPEGKGSNGIAVGGDSTGNGRGMLLGSPHQPWFGASNRFHVLHQTLPGEFDVMGANLINRPNVGFGATQDVAWTSTVSTASRFNFYMLILLPGNPTTYIFDGVPTPMTANTVTVTVKNPDGSLSEVSRTFYRTHFGAYMVGGAFPWNSQIAFAARFTEAGWRGADALIPQYQATTVEELKAVHDAGQFLPVNLIAADSSGRTLYADPGPVPNVTDAKFADCAVFFGSALDGSRSDCMWGTDPDSAVPGIYGASNLPSLFRDDYVSNSNDTFWLANPAEPLTGFNSNLGVPGSEQTLRTRSANEMIEQRLDGSDGLGGTGFTLEQLQTITLQNRNKAGEILRDGLVALCDANPVVTLGDGSTVDISEACPILANWDLRSDLDSRGAVLSREVMRDGNGGRRLPTSWNYLVPFDPADPLNTPRDLDPTNNPAALEALAGGVQRLRDAGIALDVALGDVQSVTRNGERIPLHGGEEFEGVFNKLSARFEGAAGYPEVTGSSASWIQATEFTEDGPRIRGLLTYSLSTNPDSPHYSDQTKLYSAKEWVDIPFDYDDVRHATLSQSDLSEGFLDCLHGGWQDFEEPVFSRDLRKAELKERHKN